MVGRRKKVSVCNVVRAETVVSLSEKSQVFGTFYVTSVCLKVKPAL